MDRQLTSWGIYLFTFDESVPVEQVIQKLQADPAVQYAEPNARITAFAHPQDQDEDPPAGTLLTQGSGTPVIVAILDTGLDFSHPAFSARSLATESITTATATWTM